MPPASDVPGYVPSAMAATDRRGLFCFPALPSYTLTHQWLRELARHGGPRALAVAPPGPLSPVTSGAPTPGAGPTTVRSGL
ncbi:MULTISPECIES: hypothetical protein [unclassified Streptomyces]|uniref:hypothetical protein n=2 Tax=Streptomyces TaxID=1883 RepID=UPI002E810AFE|nr:hypothetical protein [Streptomyces sp. NBC_00562]